MQTEPTGVIERSGATPRTTASRRWSFWLVAWAAMALPSIAGAERLFGTDGISLFAFDSEDPGTLEYWVTITGTAQTECPLGLESDPLTGRLYAVSGAVCQILPPPWSLTLHSLNPASGDSVFADVPYLEVQGGYDQDLHPGERAFRMIGSDGTNLRLPLGAPLGIADSPLEIDGHISALAHAPNDPYASGIETFGIAEGPQFGQCHLVRIGGPSGAPPASTGEVTSIGPCVVAGDVWAFEVTPSGRALLMSAYFDGQGFRSHLYEIELQTGATTFLGQIATPEFGAAVTGIAWAPEGAVIEIPTLSGVALTSLGGVLVAAALARLAVRRRGEAQPR